MMASMACAFVLCIPFFAFPKVVPGTDVTAASAKCVDRLKGDIVVQK